MILVFSVVLCTKEKKNTEPSEFETMAKDIITLLVQEDYGKVVNMFDDKMKEDLPAEKLREVWENLIMQSGSFKNYGISWIEKVADFNAVIIICEFEKSKIDVRVVFNKEKRISGLFFVPK